MKRLALGTVLLMQPLSRNQNMLAAKNPSFLFMGDKIGVSEWYLLSFTLPYSSNSMSALVEVSGFTIPSKAWMGSGSDSNTFGSFAPWSSYVTNFSRFPCSVYSVFLSVHCYGAIGVGWWHIAAPHLRQMTRPTSRPPLAQRTSGFSDIIDLQSWSKAIFLSWKYPKYVSLQIEQEVRKDYLR